MLHNKTNMNQQHYIDILLSNKLITKVEAKGKDIIVYSPVEEKHQLSWILVCDIYDRQFITYINNIIVL